MSTIAAELWGCPGLSVGVHRYNNGIGTPLFQLNGPEPPDPKFNNFKYLISEKDVRFIIVVNILTQFLPINNILIGDILSVDLYLDGHHVSTFLWDTHKMMREGTPRVAIFMSPANPTTGEAKTFSFSEPEYSSVKRDHIHNPLLGTIRVVVSHATGHMDNRGLPLMEDHTRVLPDNSKIPQGRFPREISPHVITYHREENFPVRPSAGMMKTGTVLQPCSFNFQYGTRHTIEYLTGRQIRMPGEDVGVAPAPAPPAVHGNNMDVAARSRQNAPELQRHQPRPIESIQDIMDGSLHRAHNQVMAVLRNFASDFAGNMADRAQRRDAALGSALAGPANPIRTQNQPTRTGPPPVVDLPVNTSYPRQAEIDRLQLQLDDLRSELTISLLDYLREDHDGPMPVIDHTTHVPRHHRASDRLPVGASHFASTAVPDGSVRRRRRATPSGDSHAPTREGPPASSAGSRLDASIGSQPHPLLSSTQVQVAVSGSRVAAGVPENRAVDVNRAAHTQQALAVTSAREASGVAGSVDQVTGGSDSNAGPAEPNPKPEGHDVNRSAITERTSRGAAAGEDAAIATNVGAVANQDPQNVAVPNAANDKESTSKPADPVNNTAKFGSESGHSPPHKKQKLHKGDDGGATGDNDAKPA